MYKKIKESVRMLKSSDELSENNRTNRKNIENP